MSRIGFGVFGVVDRCGEVWWIFLRGGLGLGYVVVVDWDLL